MKATCAVIGGRGLVAAVAFCAVVIRAFADAAAAAAVGLTSAQVKQIRYNGSKVTLTAEGYLGGPKGLMIIVR